MTAPGEGRVQSSGKARAIVPSEAFDPTHPDHDEWVGADNSRCLADECALHHDGRSEA